MQLFFVATKGLNQIQQALDSREDFHSWSDTDHLNGLTLGVIELRKSSDAEPLIAKLEGAGILWLPNHLAQPNQKISAEHVAALSKFGVTASDTTYSAMMKVWQRMCPAGEHHPLKPSRF